MRFPHPDARADHPLPSPLGILSRLLLISAVSLVAGSMPSPAGDAAPVSASTASTDREEPPESSPEFAWDPAEEPPPAAAEEGEPEGTEEPPAEGKETESVPAEEVDLLYGTAEPAEAPVEDLGEVEPELTPDEIKKERVLVETAAPEYDIPMSYNEKVLAWVDYYSSRHRDRFLPGLVRSGRYLPMIRRIFAEEGIPQDLAFMAHVESAYKPNAYSRSHAKGIFQFIASTGRRYGLRNDYWVDERSDPEKATRAAAAYLKDLYAMFGDWYLAMAAYNAGEGRISRAMAATGAKDFWTLALTSHIHTETKNYVPAILAATLISKDPGKYGFEYTPDRPYEYETIEVRGAYDLKSIASSAGSDFETIKELNPALRRLQTAPDRTTEVRVPRGSGEATLVALAKVPQVQRVVVTAKRHKVRRGETLSTIARKYRTSVRAIQRENRMGRSTVVRTGQSLRIPGRGPVEVDVAEARPAARTKTGGSVVYRVRRGDTMTALARRHDTSVKAIAAANGFSTRRVLRTGEKIRIPASSQSVTASTKARGSGGSTRKVHTVRRGETLWGIATRYRVTVDALCAWNDISVRSPLHPGTRLTIRR